jgi:hypothetical protein
MIGNPAKRTFTAVDPNSRHQDNQASYSYKRMLKVKSQGVFCSQLTTVTTHATQNFLHPPSQENQLYIHLAITKLE